MKILDDTKSLSVLANDTSNGLGQIGCINPTITENLNGSYELEFDIATSEKYFSLLHTGGLVKCLHNTSEQIFRIYFISKAINGIVNVKAQHITYDLCGVVVKPFTATGAVSSVNGMLTNVIGTTPFTMTTDITNTTSNFTLDIPRSFRECLGGYEGSLLDVFRGEYEWDNLTVRMLAHRGADNGVRIAYGKNLTDFTQEENNENVYTGVLGYATVDEQTYVGNVYTKVSSNNPRAKIVDFSSDYESGQTPTVAELTTKAQTYATNNPIEVPNVNIKVSFVPLWQTEEYKNILPLERVSLGDTVHVYFEKLNVEATARVIKTVWNVNLERYDEIELGDAKANLNTVINESVDSAVNNAIGDLDIDTGAIESEMFQMSKLIANGMGLHMTKDSIGRIFLHNAEDLSQSQYQYEITSNGFMLSDDYGQTWNSGWDISGNAVVNSLATITLKFLEGYGMFMRFGDINSNYIDVAPYSDGVSFDGSGTVRFQPQNEFIVRNISSSNSLYNLLDMNHLTSRNNVLIENYNASNGSAKANDFQLANDVRGGYAYNYAQITNYCFVNNNLQANTIRMDANATNHSLALNNNIYGEEKPYNELRMIASSTNSFNFEIINGRYYITSSQYTDGNSIRLHSSSALGNYISIYNRQYNSDIASNYISLRSNDTMVLYSRSDIFLNSGGAIRMSSGSGQDIVISSVDSLKLSYTKLYFNGTKRNLVFDSDGYVKWNSN